MVPIGQPWSFSLLALTGFVFPLSIGYAVARHDLFEADRFVKRTVVYAALTSIVSLAYGGEGLGAAWGEQKTVEYLENAGFTEIEVTGVREDRANSFFIARA